MRVLPVDLSMSQRSHLLIPLLWGGRMRISTHGLKGDMNILAIYFLFSELTNNEGTVILNEESILHTLYL